MGHRASIPVVRFLRPVGKWTLVERGDDYVCCQSQFRLGTVLPQKLLVLWTLGDFQTRYRVTRENLDYRVTLRQIGDLSGKIMSTRATL
jgi:hypothetical protein